MGIPRADPAEEPCPGSVIRWDERGFGFVQCEDGRKAYVHHSAFGSGNLAVGEQVSVTVAPDQRNPEKWMVKRLTRDESAANLSMVTQDAEDWHVGMVLDWHEDTGTGTMM